MHCGQSQCFSCPMAGTQSICSSEISEPEACNVRVCMIAAAHYCCCSDHVANPSRSAYMQSGILALQPVIVGSVLGFAAIATLVLLYFLLRKSILDWADNYRKTSGPPTGETFTSTVELCMGEFLYLATGRVLHNRSGLGIFMNTNHTNIVSDVATRKLQRTLTVHAHPRETN